jgi:RNA-directed DNA polymerase
VKAHAGVSAGTLIASLNPLIRGWVNYHRHVVSKAVFAAVDHAIFKALWRWAKRRHPHKRHRWIREKYFKTIGGRHWVFSGQRRTRQGETQDVRLGSAADGRIRQHVKIKGEANPYDPAWETYFEERLGVRMAGTLRGRRKLLYLWRQQRGLCPVCNQKITTLTGWHSHHIVWRSLGGGDGTENRALLHPNCHRQVHSRGIEVTTPCSSDDTRGAGLGARLPAGR